MFHSFSSSGIKVLLRLGRCSTGVNVLRCLPQRINSSISVSAFLHFANLPAQAKKKPFIMKLDCSEFSAIFTPELNVLADLFKKHGYELRIAGGAVRDLLMGVQPKDLDFATTATPDEMKKMFTEENIRMINMKGEKHGTITARINEKENFEVTTLRIDVETDGRHAEVQFTTDWQLDSNRRDLTFNSMFLGLDGTVYDYFNGHEDLKKRRVVFVGDARTRIREDYLRILRYFRFYGRVSNRPNDHEEATLKAIEENVGGLERISGERIWSELRRILEGSHAGELVTTMLSLGVAPYIGLPAKPNMEEFQRVWKRSGYLHLKPMTLLSALIKDVDEAVNLNARLKLSAYERDLSLFMISHREDKPSVMPLKPYQAILAMTKSKVSDTREWIVEVLKYRGEENLMNEFQLWETPRFPVRGNMLKDLKVPEGRQLGRVSNKLKVYWIEHEFKPTAEELLKRVPDVLADLGIEPEV